MYSKIFELIADETIPASVSQTTSRFSDICQLVKLRLASLVVFSAAISYLFVATAEFKWSTLILLVLGGFFVTGSSNGFNQIIERDLDKLMDRTANRPLPSGRMSVQDAVVISAILGVLGIVLLMAINFLTGFLGAVALFLYTIVYTPMKKQSPFAVFVGAFPGAIPPMLGCIAATEGQGSITFVSILLFTIQFIWQFPHFWAIAWVLDDDYKKAGFNMLPSLGGRDKRSAFQIFVYSVALLLVSILPFAFHITGTISMIIILITGFMFIYQSILVYKNCSIKDAQKLMFASFIYLPVVQVALLLDKI